MLEMRFKEQGWSMGCFCEDSKIENGGATRVEICNLFENLKMDIMNFVSSQLDILQVK